MAGQFLIKFGIVGIIKSQCSPEQLNVGGRSGQKCPSRSGADLLRIARQYFW